MKFKISYILLLLLLGLGFTAVAQKKKPAKKATKVAVKKTAKAVTGKVQHKAKTLKQVAKAPVKDSATLKGATIEITQSYKPEIKQSPKPESVPLLPTVDTSTAKVNFNVPAQALYYSYNALPLRPLTLTKDSAANPFRNYIKLGAGNLSTLLLDAGIAALHSKSYETAIHIHHLSQQGTITGQKTSLTGLEAEGTFHTAKHVWDGGVNISRDVYNIYGFNDVLTVPYTPLSQQLNKIALRTGMQRISNDAQWIYNPSLSVSFLNSMGGNEFAGSLSLPLSYKIKENLHLITGLSGAYAHLTQSVATPINSNKAQLLIGAAYDNGPVKLKAVLQPTIGMSNSWYILPDISASYSVSKTQLTVFAGLLGTLRQNKFSDLLYQNPYLQYNINALRQTYANEVYGGVKTNIGHHLTIDGTVSWKQNDDMPLMINDTGYNPKYFTVVYDKMTALSFQGSIRYQIADIVSVGFGATYTSYNTTVSKRAWHQPGVVMNADLNVRPVKNLVVSARLAVMDETYALDAGNKTIKLNSAFDLGAGAEYTFMPRLAAFANVNNIFNTQYERWYGYRVYGFNIFGGLRLKF